MLAWGVRYTFYLGLEGTIPVLVRSAMHLGVDQMAEFLRELSDDPDPEEGYLKMVVDLLIGIIEGGREELSGLREARQRTRGGYSKPGS